MDARGVACFALLASLLLVVQPGIPAVSAHGGEDDGQEAEEESGSGFRLAPERGIVEQRKPDMSGPRVVWQERAEGSQGSWDVVMADLSSENVTAVTLTNTDYDAFDPVIEGDRVAWTVYATEARENENLVVMDIPSGRIFHVPDNGDDEHAPSFGGNGTLYYAADTEKGRQLKGYDPDTDQVFSPLIDRTIVSEPAAHGPWIAWAQGSLTSAKIHVKNTETGNTSKATGLYNLKDGLTMGPAGVAWIARYGGEFTRGEYAAVYNLSTGVEKFRTNVYPHSNIASCETGVIWDQPGTATTDTQAVALWDRYVEGVATVGSEAYQGTCGADHLVYEQRVQIGNDTIRQLHGIDLRDLRIFREALVTMDDDDHRSIIQGPRTVDGTVESGDPREPIQTVFGSVDGSELEELDTVETDEGLRWEAEIEPRILEPGRHELGIVAVDALGRPSQKSFEFYTETDYQIDPSSDADPLVPREEASPFPLNLINHYQDYAPFYNTLLLALLALGALAWYGYRRYTEEPTGTPEYVPPEEPPV